MAEIAKNTVAVPISDVVVLGGGRATLITDRPFVREDIGAYGRDLANMGQVPTNAFETLAKSEIKGRGGAGFPFHHKVLAALEQSKTPVVVVNGEEGEPCSVKDRYLMRFRPHLVIDGAWITAKLVKASAIYIYTADEYSADSMRRALDERKLDVQTSIVICPNTYVAGESSAATRFISHGVAKPLAKPPYPHDEGVSGLPTLVSNVETFACVALAVRSEVTPSTFLATISYEGKKAVLAEVPYGTPLSELAASVGAEQAEIVAPGGLFGGVVPTSLPLNASRESFAAASSSIGSGTFVFFPKRSGAISVAAGIATLLHSASAGQCGSCLNGTNAVRKALARMAAGETGKTTLDDLQRWAIGLKGRGACSLPDGAAVLVDTLFRHFRSELDAVDETTTPFEMNWSVLPPSSEKLVMEAV